MTFYVVRPIEQWPGALTRNRKRATFRTDWPRTEAQLERELRHLYAKDVVLALAVDSYDIRIDGGLRANARPVQHPGVIISFGSKFGPLQYATDTYLDWKANARAICLGLEALRAVDRYGVTKRGEQYAGWAKLPSAVSDMGADEARTLLTKLGGFRAAAMANHPDRGGDAVLFRRVTAAKAVLEAAGAQVP